MMCPAICSCPLMEPRVGYFWGGGGGGVHYLDTWSTGSTSHAVEYKKNMAEDDPRALFQEQIPMSFLELQKAIKKEVASRSVTGNPPVMVEEEFKYVCCVLYIMAYCM